MKTKRSPPKATAVKVSVTTSRRSPAANLVCSQWWRRSNQRSSKKALTVSKAKKRINTSAINATPSRLKEYPKISAFLSIEGIRSKNNKATTPSNVVSARNILKAFLFIKIARDFREFLGLPVSPVEKITADRAVAQLDNGWECAFILVTTSVTHIRVNENLSCCVMAHRDNICFEL